jgi:hypothetical protein
MKQPERYNIRLGRKALAIAAAKPIVVAVQESLLLVSPLFAG